MLCISLAEMRGTATNSGPADGRCAAASYSSSRLSCLGTRLAAENGMRRGPGLRAADDVLSEVYYVPLLLGALGERAEELADHGEVISAAGALLRARAISPPFEDPRVCETLRK